MRCDRCGHEGRDDYIPTHDGLCRRCVALALEVRRETARLLEFLETQYEARAAGMKGA